VRVETSLIDAAASHELLDNPQSRDRSLQYSVFRRSSERSYDTSHKPVYGPRKQTPAQGRAFRDEFQLPTMQPQHSGRSSFMTQRIDWIDACGFSRWYPACR
jgi:hypothetical protein